MCEVLIKQYYNLPHIWRSGYCSSYWFDNSYFKFITVLSSIV